VARRIDRDPFAVVASTRSGHSGPLVSAGVPELHLEPLDRSEARDVLDKCAPDLNTADREQILAAASAMAP
jgi:hypothetical protein